MARVTAFCLSGSLAHAGRVATVAGELARRGHEVTLAGAPGWFAAPEVVEPGAFAQVELAEPPLDVALAAARGERSTGEVERFLRAYADDLGVIERTGAEVVLVDNRRSATMAAWRAGKPSLSLTTAALLGPYCGLVPTVEEASEVLGPSMGLGPDTLLRRLRAAGKGPRDPLPLRAARLPSELSDALARDGLRGVRAIHQLAFGTRTLVLDPPELLPARDLPSDAHQPGPIFPELRVPLPPWWTALDPDRPVVYLTFGSTGRPEVFARVAEALASLDAQLVVSTADLIAEAPGEVFTARFMPGWSILERADLVVCHGGTLTVYHALAAGTPVIALPSHVEQGVTGIGLNRSGRGVAVPQTALDDDPELLARIVTRLLGAEPLVRAAAAGADPERGAGALRAAGEAVDELVARFYGEGTA